MKAIRYCLIMGFGAMLVYQGTGSMAMALTDAEDLLRSLFISLPLHSTFLMAFGLLFIVAGISLPLFLRKKRRRMTCDEHSCSLPD